MDTFTLDDLIASTKELARNNAKKKLSQIKGKATTGCTIGPTYYGMTPEFDAESVERYCVAAEKQAVHDLFYRLLYGRDDGGIGAALDSIMFDAGPLRESI